MLRSLVLGSLLVATTFSSADAQQWARKMFKVTSHDFKTVARNSKTEFAFELQNIYEEDIHIAAVRSSCGCTEPRITKKTLKTWEEGSIVAALNTKAFLGQRSATLTVTIDRPYFAEVQLSVRGYIRGDVVFEPGEVAFGELEQGTEAERTVTVSYAGRSDWKIVDVRSVNEHIEVELLDENRSSRRVTVRMLVRLKKDAPVGYFHDPLLIVTNDASMSSLELPVEGHVASPLTVSPASLFLGLLKPGQSVTKRLVIRASQPFRITGIECADSAFKFKKNDKAALMHLIPVTYTAGARSGKVLETIRIRTDLKSGKSATCTASATITEQEVAAKP